MIHSRNDPSRGCHSTGTFAEQDPGNTLASPQAKDEIFLSMDKQMGDSESLLKLYVNDLNQIPFVCPSCGFSKLVPLQSLSSQKRLLRLKCRCGTPFKVQLEFRRYARKNTRLSGTFSSGRPGGSDLPVNVVNLSRGGACFESSCATMLQVGDKGVLHFRLDDKSGAMLTKKVVIKSIHATKVGCAFTDQNEYEKALGFYLMS